MSIKSALSSERSEGALGSLMIKLNKAAIAADLKYSEKHTTLILT